MNRKKISSRGWIMLIMLFLLTVISNIDKAIIGYASIPLMKELGLNSEQWGIVGSVFFLLYSLSAILVGGLADKVGTKKVIFWMALIWACVQFSTIFVSSFTFLLITRIILGAGEGPSYSIAMTAASKWLPKEKMGFGFTFVSIGGPFGVAIAAPFLVQIIAEFGWRAAFIAAGTVGIVWVVMWLILSKEQPDTYQVTSEKKVSKDEDGATFKEFLFSRNFLLVAFCGFGTYWAFTVGLNWLPNYLSNVRNLSTGTLSWVSSIPWVLIACSQLFFSSISDKRYARTKDVVKSRVLILGPVLFFSGVLYLLGATLTSNFFAISFLSLGLSLGCLTLVLGPVILVDFVKKKDIGKVQGWFMAVTSLGGVAGPYITGRIVNSSVNVSDGFHLAFQVCGILLIVIGICSTLFIRPKKAKQIEAQQIEEVKNIEML